MMRVVKTWALIGALMLVAAACGGGDDTGVKVGGVWARSTSATQTSGAVYMHLISAEGDAVIGVAVSDSVAGGAAIHETVTSEMHTDMSDDMAEMHEGMSDEDIAAMDTAGAMLMVPIARLELAPGESFLFQPGGYHVMLTDLVAPLEVGQKFDLTLTFETAGEIVVKVDVLQDAP